MPNWFRVGAVAMFLCVAAPGTLFAQTTAATDKVVDRVAVHVNSSDPQTWTAALNNIEHMFVAYKERGETVRVEVVAHGPGLTMLRTDSSPVQDRIAAMARNPALRFSACANTVAAATKREGKRPELLAVAKVVPSGVVRIIRLEKRGYAYLKP